MILDNGPILIGGSLLSGLLLGGFVIHPLVSSYCRFLDRFFDLLNQETPDDFGTGDLGLAARRHERVAEGGYRPAGDPGPRRLMDQVDPASGIPKGGA